MPAAVTRAPSPVVTGAVVAVAVMVMVTVAGSGAVGAAPASTGQTLPTVTTDVEYHRDDNGPLLLDVYEPADGATSRPAVVLVHGGGWTTGDRNEVAPDALSFAEAGMVAFSIDYDLDGPDRWQGQMTDVQMAVRWVQTNATTYAVDPTRVGLFGSSAGGNLSMMVGAEGLDDAGAPPVRTIVSWSGPTDLTVLAPTNVDGSQLTGAPGTIAGAEVPVGCVDNDQCIGVLDPQAIQAYLGCTVDDCPQTYVDASPSYQVTASTPPMLLVSAQTDLVPAEQSYEMVNALSAVGVANEILLVAGEGHAESYRDVALGPTIDFLNRYLVDGADPRTATTTPPSTVAGSQALPPLGADNRLPTPEPPPAVQAVLAPASHGVWWLLGGAAVLAVVAGVVNLLRRRR